jgi:hypothetical protein
MIIMDVGQLTKQLEQAHSLQDMKERSTAYGEVYNVAVRLEKCLPWFLDKCLAYKLRIIALLLTHCLLIELMVGLITMQFLRRRIG